MTLRTINGLQFRVTSPSFWELVGYPIELNYLGDCWYVTVAHKAQPQMKPLESFTQGVELIQRAFAEHPV